MKLYLLLDHAQAGDVIRMQWNNNTYNLMLVRHNDGLAFYSIEQKNLFGKNEMKGFTLGSGDSLQGAEILRREKGENHYIETTLVFGSVNLEDYVLPYGWNRPDGKRGVVMQPQFSSGDLLGVTATAFQLVLGTVNPGYIFTGALTFAGTALNASQIPVYYDYLPPQ
jgi:hypothetical protein